MQTAAPQKLITCILPKGRALRVARILTREHGLSLIHI
jgi:hypothetical protein